MLGRQGLTGQQGRRGQGFPTWNDLVCRNHVGGNVVVGFLLPATRIASLQRAVARQPCFPLTRSF